jgi:hypothetical protein
MRFFEGIFSDPSNLESNTQPDRTPAIESDPSNLESNTQPDRTPAIESDPSNLESNTQPDRTPAIESDPLDNRCYACAQIAMQVDYNVAHGRFIRLWAFVVIVTAGLGAAMIASINDGSAPVASILLVPVVAVGSWFFYMGMSWAYEKLRGRGIAVGGFVSGGGRATNPVDAVWPLIVFGLIFVILFMVLSWIVMLIGLFTGFQKYKLDRKVIGIYNEGWTKLFPGKYVPDIRYIPEVPPYDLDRPTAYDRDLASPSSAAIMPSGDEVPRRWQEVVEALEAINALQPSDEVNDRLGESCELPSCKTSSAP